MSVEQELMRVPRKILQKVALSQQTALLIDKEKVFNDVITHWPLIDPTDPKVNLALAEQLKRDPNSGRRWTRMMKDYKKYFLHYYIKAWISENWLSFKPIDDLTRTQGNLALSTVDCEFLTEGKINNRLLDYITDIVNITEKDTETLGFASLTDDLASHTVTTVWCDLIDDFKFSPKQFRDFRLKHRLVQFPKKYLRHGMAWGGKIRINYIGYTKIKKKLPLPILPKEQFLGHILGQDDF
jgi:hypothetical protein